MSVTPANPRASDDIADEDEGQRVDEATIRDFAEQCYQNRRRREIAEASNDQIGGVYRTVSLLAGRPRSARTSGQHSLLPDRSKSSFTNLLSTREATPVLKESVAWQKSGPELSEASERCGASDNSKPSRLRTRSRQFSNAKVFDDTPDDDPSGSSDEDTSSQVTEDPADQEDTDEE